MRGFFSSHIWWDQQKFLSFKYGKLNYLIIIHILILHRNNLNRYLLCLHYVQYGNLIGEWIDRVYSLNSCNHMPQWFRMTIAQIRISGQYKLLIVAFTLYCLCSVKHSSLLDPVYIWELKWMMTWYLVSQSFKLIMTSVFEFFIDS